MDKKLQSSLAQKVLAMAKKAGATDAVVEISKGTGITATSHGGVSEGVTLKNSAHAQVTAYVGQKSAVSPTTDLSDAGLQSMVDRAVATAKSSQDDPHAGLPTLAEQNVNWEKEHQALDLVDPNNMPDDMLIRKCAEEADKASRNVPGITNGGAEASFSRSLDTIAMSTGFNATSYDTGGHIVVEPIIGHGESMLTDYEYESALHWDDLPDPSDLGKKAADKMLKRKTSVEFPKDKAGVIPVVLAPEKAGLLKGNLAQCLHAATLERGLSFIQDDLGKKVFSDELTLVDDRTRVRGLGSRVFDDDGIAGPEKLELVKDGTIKNWLLGHYNTRKLNAEKGSTFTPNGRDSPSNLCILPGKTSVDDLFKDIKFGFYLTGAMSPVFQSNNGNLSFSGSGFIIRDGKLCEYVLTVAVGGNLADMLNNLTIADDFTEKYNAPTILVEGMTVSV